MARGRACIENHCLCLGKLPHRAFTNDSLVCIQGEISPPIERIVVEEEQTQYYVEQISNY